MIPESDDDSDKEIRVARYLEENKLVQSILR